MRNSTEQGYASTQLRILSEINRLSAELRLLRSGVPIYDIQNENTPTQFVANQNNLDPGDYDVLRISSDASRDITGFSNGVKGRILILYNVGANNIVLKHNSGSSAAANRISIIASADYTLIPGDTAALYYDSTTACWRLVPYAPLASPTFTGDPKAPTPTATDNDTSIATTAFVQSNKPVIGKNTNDIFRVNAPGGAMRWSGTISVGGISADRLSITVSAPTTGQEAALVPYSTSQLAKLRVYNSTRSNNYGLISNYNTGTNIITLVSAAPANWIAGDTLTITSPTVSGGTLYWADLEMTDSTYLSRTALKMVATATSATVLDVGVCHPYDASYSASKRIQAIVPAANSFAVTYDEMQWITNLLSIALQGTWTGASDAFFIRVSGYIP